MSTFEELLNAPLPSKREQEVMTESEEINEEVDTIDNELETEINDVDTSDDLSVDDTEDLNFDIDDLSDEELMALDADLTGQAVDAVADAEAEPQVTLSPQEEMRADDLMATAATSMLVRDELNAQEKEEFFNDEADVNTVLTEGFLTSEDIDSLVVSTGFVTEAKYNSKMIIKLSKDARMKQLFALGVNVSAAAHGDKDYIKLKKLMKMRRILRARLSARYKNEATKRARIYMQRLNRSGSKTLQALAKK